MPDTPGDPSRPVDRCICRSVLFSELIQQQRETGATLDELKETTGCGTGCGLCVPYIKVALHTGEAHLPVLNDDELKRRSGGE